MISKERFEQIALEVLWKIKQPNDPEAMAKLYAHALIKAVEAESEIVDVVIGDCKLIQLIALPLVEGETT